MTANDVPFIVWVSSISAFLRAVFGLDARQVMWGITGSIIGASLWSQAGIWYSIARFISASLSSALLGSVIATVVNWPDHYVYMYASILLLGIGFHPVISAFLDAVPAVVQALKRILIKWVEKVGR